MKTTMKLSGIIAIVAVIGFSMAACTGLDFTGSGGGGSSSSVSANSATVANTSLNGAWVGKINKNTYLMSFNDGNYSVLTNGHNSERGDLHFDWQEHDDDGVSRAWRLDCRQRLCD